MEEYMDNRRINVPMFPVHLLVCLIIPMILNEPSGWWLSMKPEDSFLKRMQPLTDVGRLMMKKERFGTFNEKTFGLIIVSQILQHKKEEQLKSEGQLTQIR